MKLLNILGAVVVVHIAVLILAVAIPGCRTTSSMSSKPAPAAAPMPSPMTSMPELQDRDLNPPLANTSAAAFDPNASATTSTSASSRYSPTRPSGGTPLNPVILPETAPVTKSVVTYTVKGGDNLWTLAKKNGVSVRELAAANDLAPNSGLRVGQVLVIPVDASVAAVPTAAPADTANTKSYTIRPGDTLAKIARAHGSTVSQLKAFNNLRSDMVRAGDRLSIPVTEQSESAAAFSSPGTTTTTPASTISPKQGVYQHVVASGESLTVIAQKYGVKIGDIALANNIRNPALIRPGQSLAIPGWEAPTKVETPQAIATPVTTTGRTVTVLSEDDDLDAGLDDDDLDNVPVITVEEPPITTISTDADKDGGPAIFE